MAVRRSLAVALACGAALTIVACGGGDDSSTDGISTSDANSVKSVLALGETVQKALESSDASGVCKSLDPAGVKRQFGGRAGCVRRLNATMNANARIPDYSFGEVIVDGNTATAKSGNGSNLHFKKVNGEWYIDISPRGTQSSGDQ